MIIVSDDNLRIWTLKLNDKIIHLFTMFLSGKKTFPNSMSCLRSKVGVVNIKMLKLNLNDVFLCTRMAAVDH